MLKKKIAENQLIYNFQLEDYVPKDHFLRKVKENIDFNFIYEKVKHLYPNKGQTAIDPVVLIKMLLIGYFYNIKSERRLEQEIKFNLLYRWFIDYNIDEKIPDHSTISQTRRRKFKDSQIFQNIFDEIVHQCMKKGFIIGETILSDSTLVKANASLDSLKKIPAITKEYIESLDKLTETKRDEKYANETHISKTDPESKLAFKKTKMMPPGLYYHEHKSMDISGYVTDVYITPGNLNEHKPYIKRLERQMFAYGFKIKNTVADSAYGLPEIYKELEELEIKAYIPFRDNGRKKDNYFEKKDFIYVKEKDSYVCPEGIELSNKCRFEQEKTTIYYAATKKCTVCKSKKQCMKTTSKRLNPKTIRRHFYQDLIDNSSKRLKTDLGHYMMRKRKVLIEGSFGDAKLNHGFWRTKFRGVKSVQEQSFMTAIAQNIKKFIKDLGRKNPFNLQNSFLRLKNRINILKNLFAYNFI